jgi:glycosyltransferase involved in cell wall biosynthesis
VPLPIVDEPPVTVQEAPRMRVLVWQWGRRGAGPLLAAHLADALRSIPRTEAFLSLPRSAEILQGNDAPDCALPVDTYAGSAGVVWRLLQAPVIVPRLVRRLSALGPDIAVCAMLGPLDLLYAAALRWLRIPMVVIVHDADRHEGDRFPLLMMVQRSMLRSATAIVALSQHVAARLQTQAVARQRPFVLRLPPLTFGPAAPGPRTHGGPLRLLFFGRLLPYKGLGLLKAAIDDLGCCGQWALRVIGSGPESTDLDALRATPGVTVENRWVPDGEIAALIAWADAIVLPYVEASQSGVAPSAIAAGRIVVATRVGGLAEQVRDYSLARLCDPQPESLAAVLRHLLDEDLTATATCISDPSKEWRCFATDLVDRVITPILGHDLKMAYSDHTLRAV